MEKCKVMSHLLQYSNEEYPKAYVMMGHFNVMEGHIDVMMGHIGGVLM